MKLHTLLLLGVLACGGDAVVDGSSNENGSNNSNNSVTSGAGSNACPMSPTQDQVKNLEGKTCLDEDKECAAYFICDGCSVTCKSGMWVATGSEVCFSLGATC
jgi:hypothetical protein